MAPKAPAAPPDPLQAALALVLALPGLVLDRWESLLDRAVELPLWLAWMALGLALLFTVLHRHALRPVSALVLAGLLAALALGPLRDALPAQGVEGALAGVVAVVAAGASLGLGLVAPTWASGAIAGTCGAALGGLGAVHVAGIHWLFGAVPAALLGLFTGLANLRGLAVWMPPLWGAVLATLGAARLATLAPEESQLRALAHAPASLGLLLVLGVLLLGLSLEREQRARRRAALAETQAAKDALARKRFAKE